jgi:hypothetical protein
VRAHGVGQGARVPVRLGLGEPGAQLGEGARSFLEVRSRRRDEPVEVEPLQPATGDGAQRAGERRLEGRAQPQVVLRHHEVQGGAHERCPDDPPLLYKAGEVLATEASEPGPQADVRRARHLGLQANEALDSVGDGKRLPAEQHLPGERRTDELAERQDAVLHKAPTLPTASDARVQAAAMRIVRGVTRSRSRA